MAMARAPHRLKFQPQILLQRERSVHPFEQRLHPSLASPLHRKCGISLNSGRGELNRLLRFPHRQEQLPQLEAYFIQGPDLSVLCNQFNKGTENIAFSDDAN